MAQCEVRTYGKDQKWDGRIVDVDTDSGMMTFDVLNSGQLFGRFKSPLVGEHNLYNQVAAVASLEKEGITAAQLADGFRSYRGLKRRQEVIGEPHGVTVVDDFAHHPTAVKLTLEALKLRFGGRRIWAIFEPRSNSSRRNVFQKAYAESFGGADIVVIAPPQNMDSIPENERMNVNELVADIRRTGKEAFVWGQQETGGSSELVADCIAAHVVANTMSGDVVAILSNGGFGGLHKKIINGLKSPPTTA